MSGTIGEGAGTEKRREPGYLPAAKIAVVVMGIMIVVGLAVIAVTVAKRLSGPTATEPAVAEPAATEPAGPVPPATIAVGDHTVTIPHGADVRDMTLDGRSLALRLALADGTTAILLIDITTGATVGTLHLVPEAR